MTSLDAAIRLLFRAHADPQSAAMRTDVATTEPYPAWQLRAEEIDEAVLTGKLPEAFLDRAGPEVEEALQAWRTGDA